MIGAGPYGIAVAHDLWVRGVDFVVAGEPFELWHRQPSTLPRKAAAKISATAVSVLSVENPYVMKIGWRYRTVEIDGAGGRRTVISMAWSTSMSVAASSIARYFAERSPHWKKSALIREN